MTDQNQMLVKAQFLSDFYAVVSKGGMIELFREGAWRTRPNGPDLSSNLDNWRVVFGAPEEIYIFITR